MTKYIPEDDELVNDDDLLMILEDEDVVLYDWSPSFFRSDDFAMWLAKEMVERVDSNDILWFNNLDKIIEENKDGNRR